MTTEPRPRYRKRRRAELEAATRERITEAAVKLHGTVGPANTTVAAIAREAGVQRATVYRHFPDDEAIFDACTAHYYAAHPLPDPSTWTDADPAARLAAALADVYGWYAASGAMMANAQRDFDHVPASAIAAFRGYFALLVETLVRGRRERGRRRERVAAAIGHALAFSTWTSLTEEQDLSDEEAIELMCGMVGGV